jgi:hypothetical protein
VKSKKLPIKAIRTLAVAVAAAIGVIYAAPAMAQEKLTVW